jgi:hypothetical protein
MSEGGGVTLSIHDCKGLKAIGSQGHRRPASINQMSEGGGGTFNIQLQRIKSERLARPPRAGLRQPNEQRRGWGFKSFGNVWYHHQNTLSFTLQIGKAQENGPQQPDNKHNHNKV